MLKFSDVESVKIACWVSAVDFDAHKQSLFFIHGSGSDHTAWSHQYARLHKKYNIVALDLPGHGHSGGSGESDVKAYCLWIRKLLDILDLKNTVLIAHSLAKENRAKLSDPLRRSITQSKVDILYGDLVACNNLDLTEEICKINVPACIICGAEDKMTPPDFSRQLAANINGARLEIVTGAGHMVMLERPDEFNMFLDKFAASISAVVNRKD
ncbi:hypothetical protein DS62_04545 [Smithella sp. SC_K08D17]|nr:hypothetical protein KD27_05000 [Smithella sp. D17]KIE17303.1 hypothetical protein DS62_04545 [Smithella sp. SC_K08D17]